MDLGKVTVFSDSPAAIKPNPSSRGTYSCSLSKWPCSMLSAAQLLDITCARRSPSCAKLKPANPTMKGLEL